MGKGGASATGDSSAAPVAAVMPCRRMASLCLRVGQIEPYSMAHNFFEDTACGTTNEEAQGPEPFRPGWIQGGSELSCRDAGNDTSQPAALQCAQQSYSRLDFCWRFKMSASLICASS